MMMISPSPWVHDCRIRREEGKGKKGLPGLSRLACPLISALTHNAMQDKDYDGGLSVYFQFELHELHELHVSPEQIRFCLFVCLFISVLAKEREKEKARNH